MMFSNLTAHHSESILTFARNIRHQMSQQSISRFFTKSPKKVVKKEPEIDLTQIQNEQKSTRAAQERIERFNFDKSGNTTISTDEQLKIRQEYKAKLINTFQTQNRQPIDDEVSDAETPPAKKSKGSKLTPLDQQVKDLKLQHLDKILAIQVGYKYKFYCEDAIKVSKILNIMLVPGKLNILNETVEDMAYNKLAYCSIPEPRLHIHLQRLLDNGLKVGIVDQIESQIIKSVESSSSSLFKREISNVFTKATYLEFDEKNQGIKNDKNLDSIISFFEKDGVITLVSIQPLTGRIIYDSFVDDFMNNELKTRLSHLEPLEFLYFTENLSFPIQKTLKAFDSKIRHITYPILKRTFYETYLNEYIEDNMVEFMMEQSKEFKICCSLLIEYLKEFQLDKCFKIVSNYISFKETHSMILNSNTLENLEIFQNSTNYESHGSLIWVLDHTRTNFGYRMLKSWVMRPLINQELIEERQEAIAELHSNFNHFLEVVSSCLKGCCDLQKILNRLHYDKIKRKELYIFLEKLSEFEEHIIKFGKFEILNHLKSKLLIEIFKKLIESLLELNPSDLLKMINAQYAKDDTNDDHIVQYFNLNQLTIINYDELIQQNAMIESIQDDLKEELDEIKAFLKRPSLEFIEKSKEPYLIEVRNSHLKIIPKDWLKINSTKLVSRFRTPKTIELYKQLKYHQELYLKASQEIFERFVSKVDESYELTNTIITNLSTFDCLLSLSSVSSQLNYTKPRLINDQKIIELKESRNPILETLSTDHIVPNDITLNENSSHVIITGPNMGGKSSIVKQIALVQIMAQIGCYIPAGPGSRLSCFNTILTRMGAQDDLIKGESTFFTEMSQVSKILKELESCHGNALIILDEIGRGTGTVDGISIAQAILEYLLLNSSLSKKSVVLFITHFPSLCKLINKYPNKVSNYHMGYIEERPQGVDWPKVTFLYELQKGVSTSSYGLNVAKLAGIDDEILKEAYKISKEREEQVESQKFTKWVTKANNALKGEYDEGFMTNEIE